MVLLPKLLFCDDLVLREVQENGGFKDNIDGFVCT